MDKDNLPFGMKVVIVIFAVILVAGLMLPFFSSCGTTTSQDQDTDQQDAETSSLSTAADVDATYQAKVDSYLADLAADSQSLLATANLGNTYLEWAQMLEDIQISEASSKLAASSSSAEEDGVTRGSLAADSSSDSDADSNSDAADEHIRQTYAAAIPYYQAYLAQNASKAVTVDLAIATYYSGDEQAAIELLEEFVAGNDAFSPAWYNLGVFYEDQGRYQEAVTAFENAVTADQLDPYNLAIYAYYQAYSLSAYLDASSSTADGSAASDGSASADGEVGGAASSQVATTDEADSAAGSHD